MITQHSTAKILHLSVKKTKHTFAVECQLIRLQLYSFVKNGPIFITLPEYYNFGVKCYYLVLFCSQMYFVVRN